MIQAAARLLSRYSHVNWALADQTMVSGVNFLTGILLARYLGLAEFGRFTLAWMVVLFANSIQHAIIISPMMSIGPKQSDAEMPAYYGAVMVHQVIFGVLVFTLVWAGVEASAVLFPEWRVGGLGLPLAAAAIAFQIQDCLRRYFFTRGRGGAAFANDAVRYLGQLAVLFWWFQVAPMDSTRTLWVIAAAAVAAAFYGAFLVERVEWSPAIHRSTTSRHWRFSRWLTASALMQWTAGNLFIVAAGALLGASAVGALKAAQNLMGVTHILFQGLENIVPVRAAWHFQNGGGKALRAYLRSVSVFGGLATAAVATIAAVAPAFWLRLVFGGEYSAYGHLLQWYALIYPLMFIGLPLSAGLRAVEHTRPIFAGYLATTIFSLVAAYPLVRWLELTGVMAGMLLLQAMMLVVLWRAARKSFSGRA